MKRSEGTLDELYSEHTQGLTRELLEAVPGGVVHVRRDGSIATANREALRLLGLTYDELVHRYTGDFDGETIREDGSSFPASEYPVSHVLRTGTPAPEAVIGLCHPDGTITWALFRARPILDRNSGELAGALVTFLDITVRKRAEEALRNSRELLRKAQELAHVGSWEWDLTDHTLRWTDEMFTIHGLDKATFKGTLEEVFALMHDPAERATMTRYAKDLVRGLRTSLAAEYRIRRPDNVERSVWASAELIRDASGRPAKVIGAVQDITERKQLEMHVAQSQRLDSVGQLAGGIAHDFNNLLQPIVSSADLILGGDAPAHPVATIKLAAKQAAELTRRLLAFARQHPLQRVPLDLNEVVGSFIELLRRTLGERVEVVFSPDPGSTLISADRNQIEQALLNLAINARDAMPQGGQLRIRTRSQALDAVPELQRVQSHWPGRRCALLEVSDTGMGMSVDTQARAFEPFFSTKPVGSGHGLGLAVVYGIVQRHGGHVVLESQLGGGSVFRIYLPLTETEVDQPDRASDPVVQRRGHECVLVVEDDSAVRQTTVALLRAAGYQVLAAPDGNTALLLFTQHAREIAIVVTDIVMPGLGGVELARRMRQQQPQTRVLFITGHAADAAGELVDADRVLQKPYDLQQLLAALRSLLDAPRDHAGGTPQALAVDAAGDPIER